MSNKMAVNIEELIEAVREYPVLYDRSSTAAMDEKNTKWRNLRDTYQKALKHRKELEEIGQLQRYKEYKHEDALNFLFPFIYSELTQGSVTKKRKLNSSLATNYGPTQKPTSNRSIMYKIEEVSSDNLESSAVEYLEAEEEDEIPEIEEVAIGSEEMTEDDNLKMEHDEKSFCYLPDEIPLDDDPDQKIFDKCLTEDSPVISEVEAWLLSIKASMCRLTKLNQARAKRDINAILSNYEIEQLEHSSDKLNCITNF